MWRGSVVRLKAFAIGATRALRKGGGARKGSSILGEERGNFNLSHNSMNR